MPFDIVLEFAVAVAAAETVQFYAEPFEQFVLVDLIVVELKFDSHQVQSEVSKRSSAVVVAAVEEAVVDELFAEVDEQHEALGF